MGAVKRPFFDEHDGTCLPALKSARLQETSDAPSLRMEPVPPSSLLPTPPGTRSEHDEKCLRGRQRICWYHLSLQSIHILNGITGQLPQGGSDINQDKAEVNAYSELPLRKESISPLVPFASVGCQTDGSDERDIHKCPQCSLACWLCNTAKLADKPTPEPIHNKYVDGKMSLPPSSANSSTKRRRNDGLIFLGPKDKHFEDFILRPSGVRIRAGIFRQMPEDIPLGNAQEDLSTQPEILLKLDRKAIARISTQILHWHQRLYNEGELVDLINKHLAPWEDWTDWDGPQGSVSLRRIELKVTKGGPALEKQLDYTYDWDIVPDKTYMLALNLFDDELRNAVRGPQLTWLRADSYGICPYLTLEFKCSEKSGKDSDAICQIAVASVVWLHEWKKLKEKLGASTFSDLRHYSIIINSLNFHIWLTSCDGKDFTIVQISRGGLEDPEGIEKYMKWWNAIHRWGLGTHAQSFKKDVEALWKTMKDPTLLGLIPPRSDGTHQSPVAQTQSAVG